MSKHKKDIAIIALMVVLLVVGYLFQKYKAPADSTIDMEPLKARLISMGFSWTYNGSSFPEIEVLDPLTNEQHSFPGEGRRVVIVLGNTGCSPCQTRELRNLEAMRQGLNEETEVVGLYYNGLIVSGYDYKMDALRMQKTGHTTFPIWYTSDQRLAEYMTQGQYPMIFILEGQTVVSTFAPIPSDGGFSDAFMRSLTGILNGSLPPPNISKAVEQASQRTTIISDEWPLSSIAGNRHLFGDLRGKVTIVNIWATWCGPCVKEMPTIQRLYDHYEDKEVSFVVVTNEERETVEDFLADHTYSFPIYLYEEGDPSVFKGAAIPITVILDQNGNVVLEHYGAADWNSKAVRTFINSL